jgi:hypothetical protein
MKIQKSIFEAGGIFPKGGFVLHKITSPKFTGKCSAWYQADGTLDDCEWIRRDGTRRLIPPNSPMRRHLESLGLIWSAL